MCLSYCEIFLKSVLVLSVKLLLADQDGIHFINTDAEEQEQVKDTHGHIMSVNYDYDTQSLFYSQSDFDSDTNNIVKLNLITNEVKTILNFIHGDVKQISVDWVTKKLYFINQQRKRIEVCNFDGSQRRVLFMNLGMPTSISVIPYLG